MMQIDLCHLSLFRESQLRTRCSYPTLDIADKAIVPVDQSADALAMVEA
jgi:hypothetical protein